MNSFPAKPRLSFPVRPVVPQICLSGLVLAFAVIDGATPALAESLQVAAVEPSERLGDPIADPLAPPAAPKRLPDVIDDLDLPPNDPDFTPTGAIANPTNPIDEDLGTIPIRPIPTGDDDFGELPVRPLPPPPPPPPKWLFGAARLDYFNSSNAFSTTRKAADGLIRTGLGLTAIPRLGPKTYFLGGIDGNLIRYGRYSQLNYDELRLRAGILQQLSPRMYGEIGWSNQKLYTAKDGLRSILGGSQFLNENALRLEFSRNDPLGKRLSLTSFYQLRWNLSSRPDSDRISNTAFTSLNYRLSPSWSTALDYQVSWSNYTQVDRDEVYQQVQLRTQYAVAPKLTLSLFGGFSFGGSSDDRRQFGLTGRERLQYDGWSIGVNLLFNQGLL